MKDLQKKLAHEFKNSALLETAFVHRSFVNENHGVSEHNERLEFLGDAVLELIVTKFLFQKFPKKPEGELTALRSALVKGETLAEVAAELDFGKHLKLSKGEARSGGAEKPYLLANVFEAVLGAVYLDGGFEKAKKIV
ncbi:ribonuclease III, partial [Patescibacteria group bacterium]|nr:ribonuclease III [Patescibacteria group bacterium]